MNLTPYEIALIAGGFTIVGTLLGSWIGYRNALYVYNITEFNKAASLFREAFLPEIIFLKHNAKIDGASSSGDLQEFQLSGYVHRHLSAFEIFKSNLCSKDKERIDLVWKNYCKHPDDSSLLYFEQYSTKNVSRENEKRIKETACNRIEEILNFTKHK